MRAFSLCALAACAPDGPVQPVLTHFTPPASSVDPEPCESELLAGLECTDLTPTERSLILSDLADGVFWWDPYCAAIGSALAQHINDGGRLQKFSGAGYAGMWNNFSGIQRVFLNANVFPGAPQEHERRRTVIHEATHLAFQSNDEYLANYFEYWCYNN